MSQSTPESPNQESATSPSKRITVREIAAVLDVGIPTVYTMLKQNIIPAIRVGKHWIISRASFERWLDTCGQAKAAVYNNLA